MRKVDRNAGFTLIEILVAVAILGVMAAMAFGGMNAVMTQREVALGSLERLSGIQRTVTALTGDFAQLTPRPVRGALGRTSDPPLIGDGRDENVVRLTRSGWRNPGRLPRSQLQRVAYRLEDEVLYRDYTWVLDPVLGDQPVRQEMLDGARVHPRGRDPEPRCSPGKGPHLQVDRPHAAADCVVTGRGSSSRCESGVPHARHDRRQSAEDRWFVPVHPAPGAVSVARNHRSGQ